MTDRASRERSCRAAAGDPDARAAWHRERLRHGDCSVEGLEVAGVLGDAAALVALDEERACAKTAFAWQDSTWVLGLRNDHAQALAISAARAASSVLSPSSATRSLLPLLDYLDEQRRRGKALSEGLSARIAELGEAVARELRDEAPDGPWWSVLTLERGEQLREAFLREIASQGPKSGRKVFDLWVVADNAAYYDDLLGWVISDGALTGALAWVHLTWGVQRDPAFPWTDVRSVSDLSRSCSPQQAVAQALCFALAPATFRHRPALNALVACAYAETALGPPALLAALQRDFVPRALEAKA